MNKRGQVTIFVILGIVILAIIGFLLYQKGVFTKQETTGETNEQFVNAQIEPIKSHIKDCVGLIAMKGIKLIAMQGGYFDPVYYKEVGIYNISYGCYQGANLLPTLAMVEDEFDQYMADDETQKELDECIDSFRNFEKLGLNVNEKGELGVDINILFDKVTLDINYPLEISKGDYVKPISGIYSELPVGLGKAHKVAADIINVECTNGEFDIDDYIYKNEPLCMIEVGHFDEDAYPWYLKTIPSGKEEELDFHFFVQ